MRKPQQRPRTNSLEEIAPWHAPVKKKDVFADLQKDTGIFVQPERRAEAAKIWRMWHQKEPREVIPTTYDFPKTAFKVGTADRILYSSDKWEDDGDFYTYFHDFESHPSIYTTEYSPLAKGAKRNSDVIDVYAALSMERRNSQVTLPLLAQTMELKYIGPDGKKKSYKFKGKPPMCCAADLKTLVILAEEAPIIIQGGSMVITERGIIR